MEIVSNFESSNIEKIGYEKNQSLLQVWFHNGSSYQYFDVPEAVWDAFKAHGSKGEYMHAGIRGKFRYTKV